MAKNAWRKSAEKLIVALLLVLALFSGNGQKVSARPLVEEQPTQSVEQKPDAPAAECSFSKSWDNTDFLFSGTEYTAVYDCYTFVPNPFDAVVMTATVSSGVAVSATLTNSKGEVIGGCVQTIDQPQVSCQRDFGTATQHTLLTYRFRVTGPGGVSDGWIEMHHASYDGSNPSEHHLDLRISVPIAIATIYLPVVVK